MDATVLEENYRRTPTVLGRQLVDPLRAATVPAALVVVARGGHKIPRTENRTEFTENRTEIYRTEIFGSMFGSEFARTEVPR
jgi:hypothetical protein